LRTQARLQAAIQARQRAQGPRGGSLPASAAGAAPERRSALAWAPMLRHLSASAHPPSRVVVIGARGFVGGALVKRLRRDGVPTLALSRAALDLLAPGAAASLAALLMPTDAVVAVSALAPVKNVAMLSDNLIMVRAMLEALARAPVAHVVNIGSDAIYADGPLPLTEESPMAPASLHGVMHLARELAFRAELEAPLACLRPSLLYGAADPHNGYGPNRFRRLAAAKQEIVLFGEGEERRDHVFIDDVAELIARVLAHRSVGALNIATGEVHSFREIADAVVELGGSGVSIAGSPRIGPMPHGGYRPFGIGACRTAFPDFRYTPLRAGLVASMGEPGGRFEGNDEG
jgi:UDP-glucose 4-epimerase